MYSVVVAQNSNNYVTVIENVTLNFRINSVSEIENDQTTDNAININFRNKDKTRSIYARIVSFTGPTGFSVASPYPIQIQHANNNSSNESNLVTTPITLTNTSQRLFTQVKRSSYLFQFTYDVIQKATNWNFPPGAYNFTIEFSMSPP